MLGYVIIGGVAYLVLRKRGEDTSTPASSVHGFDLGDVVKGAGKAAGDAISAVTPDFVKDAANKIADAMPQPIKDAANNNFSSQALNQFSSTLMQGLAQGAGIVGQSALGVLAATSAPFAIALDVGLVVLPGMIQGKSFDQSIQDGLLWHLAKAIGVVSSQAAGADIPGADQLSGVSQEFHDQYTQAVDYLKSIAPDDAALKAVGITPSELAEKLGIRVDVAASVLNFVKQANIYNLDQYDLTTGAPKSGTTFKTAGGLTAPTLKTRIAKYLGKGTALQTGNPALVTAARPMQLRNIGPAVIPFPADPMYTTGFLTGYGMIVTDGRTPPDLATIRGALANDTARAGFNDGVALARKRYIGRAGGSSEVSQVPTPPVSPQTTALAPRDTSHRNAAVTDESWWQKLLHLFGL